jgi:ubiquinone/menaquinone biosynthesis C-methylase UbiE
LKDWAVADWKDKRKVMQLYNVTAEMYDELYAQEQERKYKKALENVYVTGKTVLDVGCGSGLFFKEVATQACLVIGVDASLKILFKAKEQGKAFSNVAVLQADVDHLPFRDELFGAVFAFTVLQNVPKPAETLNELKRVAKKGDKIVVTGLKKAFSLTSFIDLLDGSGLIVVAFVDDEAINCYVAVLTA